MSRQQMTVILSLWIIVPETVTIVSAGIAAYMDGVLALDVKTNIHFTPYQATLACDVTNPWMFATTTVTFEAWWYTVPNQ